VDLFVPGTGIPDDGDPSVQLHDVQGGIPPSGLFWTVQIPDDSFQMSDDARRAVLNVKDLCLIDSFTFLGVTTTPAVIDAVVRWEATGPFRERGAGDEVPPEDPAAFEGRLRFARAQGRFSGTELGFAFKARGNSRPDAFAELGFERNGIFLD
jgi:hypothetical protein